MGFDVWRQCGPAVRTLALRSGVSAFKTRSDHSLNLFLHGSPSFNNFLAALVNSQLVCLRPVEIFNSLCCCIMSFRCVLLALKSPYGDWSIKYALYCIVGSLTSHRVMNKGCETGPTVYSPDLRRL